MDVFESGFQQSLCENGLIIDRHFSGLTGFDALRPEAKILFHLGAKGDLSIKEAMFVSGLSYRGLYIVLERLVQRKLIAIVQDKNDKRVRRISKGPASWNVPQQS